MSTWQGPKDMEKIDGSGWETPDDSWLEMEATGKDKEGMFYVNIITGEEDGDGQ
jgi:hypothetical protein